MRVDDEKENDEIKDADINGEGKQMPQYLESGRETHFQYLSSSPHTMNKSLADIMKHFFPLDLSSAKLCIHGEPTLNTKDKLTTHQLPTENCEIIDYTPSTALPLSEQIGKTEASLKTVHYGWRMQTFSFSIVDMESMHRNTFHFSGAFYIFSISYFIFSFVSQAFRSMLQQPIIPIIPFFCLSF